MNYSHTDNSFIEAFAMARETTVAAMLDAIAGHPDVICAPVDSSFLFGLELEAGAEPHKMQGDASYGAAFLRHMINQGLRTAFAVSADSKPIMVCLKAWEPGEHEPDWPRGKTWSLVRYHQAPQPGARA